MHECLHVNLITIIYPLYFPESEFKSWKFELEFCPGIQPLLRSDYPVSYCSILSIGLTCCILFLSVHRKLVHVLWSFIFSWMSLLLQGTDWNHFRPGCQEFTTQRGPQLRQNLWSPITSLHSLLWRSLHLSLSVLPLFFFSSGFAQAF